MPRVKSDSQRGLTGAWLRRERTSREWSFADVVAKLADLGVRVREDYYRGLEAGPRKPGPELMLALQRLYGSVAPAAVEPEPKGDSAAALIAALERHTQVMAEMVVEMRADREAAKGWAEAQAVALADIASTLEGIQLVPLGTQRSSNG